ncbi:MAG: hypothetical protein JSS20_08770 [Proteobacteria bacterium]|nr:hypothetical protein [Pseudomonadota bacterium]
MLTQGSFGGCMPIQYRRVVSIKRGCRDRFQRLMTAHIAFVHATVPETLITLRTSTYRPHDITIDERYPDREAVQAVRRRSHFDELWLPVILSLVDHVETRTSAVPIR